jgi:probable addiction module antidote protein
MIKTKPFDAADYLTDPETIRHYLADVFRDANPDEIRLALGNVARAMGETTIARKAGMTRKALRQALADEHVQYPTVVRIVAAMGYTLTRAESRSAGGRHLADRRRALLQESGQAAHRVSARSALLHSDSPVPAVRDARSQAQRGRPEGRRGIEARP